MGCFATLLFSESNSHYKSINIDLGRNIAATARDSGGAKFAMRNVAGLVSYSVNNLPADLPVRFIVALHFSTDQVTDHTSGQAFVASLIKPGDPISSRLMAQ